MNSLMHCLKFNICLLIFLSFFNYSKAQCDSLVSHYSDTCFFLTIAFTDESQGDIEKWYWDFGDGSQDSIQNPVHLYGTAGIYNVCLQIIDSCTDSAINCKDIRVLYRRPCGIIGIDVKVREVTAELFPNPSLGRLWIKLPDSESATSVIVFDAIGTQKFKLNVEKSRKEIVLNELENGVYFLQIKFTKRVEVHKFIVLK